MKRKQLVGLKPEVASLKAIGTDGENNLVDATVCNFPEAAHIHCFCHLQLNIEAHLCKHQFSSAVVSQYIQDIFRWRDDENAYRKGLVDSYNIDAFVADLSNLKRKWYQLEQQDFQDHVFHKVGFHDWFLKCKADEFHHCTLRA